MSISNLDDYFQALARLESGTPIRVPEGTQICNDSVSLEAGRGKGSIKKGRDHFLGLIREIERAREKQFANKNKPDENALKELKQQVSYFKQQYHQALARELSLVAEIYELKRKLK